MKKSLPTFGMALRENEQLKKQNKQLNSKHTIDQKRIDALIKKNNYLKNLIKKLGGSQYL
jgi:FtsZ-binding cell division protein ZapB